MRMDESRSPNPPTRTSPLGQAHLFLQPLLLLLLRPGPLLGLALLLPGPILLPLSPLLLQSGQLSLLLQTLPGLLLGPLLREAPAG